VIALDLPPPIWLPPAPAIIRARPVTPFRFIINDGKEQDCGPCLPRDLAAMPRTLRATVAARDIRPYLPEPYRRLSDGLIASLVANIGGLPGVLMAGGIKTAWLYTASGTFSAPGYWNSTDNIIHALGAGGNGQAPTLSGLVPGNYYGGAGGGGAAWAALVNAVLTLFNTYTATVGTGHGDSSWFDSIATLLAVGGGDGGAVSGGSAPGGSGGDKASCVGNLKNSGGDGGGINSLGIIITGAHGGAAAGPHGDGASNGDGDAGFGGRNGDFGGFNQFDGQDGVDGPAGGWNAGSTPNAGSGGGGGRGTGTSGSGADPNGHNGGRYGAGSGGAGVTADPFTHIGVPGVFAPGCLLLINNASL
jgi:hypothetical protein